MVASQSGADMTDKIWFWSFGAAVGSTPPTVVLATHPATLPGSKADHS